MKASRFFRALLIAYRQKWRRRRAPGKRRVFWNSIAMLIAAPLLGWAAAEGPDGKFPPGEVIFGVIVALATFIFAAFALRWSLTPSPPKRRVESEHDKGS